MEVLGEGWFNSLVGLLGLGVGTIGIILYLRSRIGPRPKCLKRGISLIGHEAQQLPQEVSVKFGNHDVPRLALATIYFWNGGKETLRGDQVVETDPLCYRFEPEDQVLKARVVSKTREVNNVTVSVPPESRHTAKLEFDYLDPGDGVRIELLHTSPALVPVASGSIRGIPRGITELSGTPTDTAAFAESLARFFGASIYIAFGLGLLAIIVGLLPEPAYVALLRLVGVTISADAPPRVLFLIPGALYAVLPAGMLFLRRKRYPTGLDDG